MEKDKEKMTSRKSQNDQGTGISAVLSCVYAALSVILLFKVPLASLLLGIGAIVAGILGRKTPKKGLATVGLAAGAAVTLFIVIGIFIALGSPA